MLTKMLKKALVLFFILLALPLGQAGISWAAETYLATVRYDRSLGEMLRSGEFNWVNDELKPENFPVNGQGVAEVEIELVPPPFLVDVQSIIDSDQAIRELESRGLRPATLPELLTLGAQHRDLQLAYTLVALGSEWTTANGHRAVPALWGVAGVRVVELFGRGVLGWRKNIRFAGVRIRK